MVIPNRLTVFIMCGHSLVQSFNTFWREYGHMFYFLVFIDFVLRFSFGPFNQLIDRTYPEHTFSFLNSHYIPMMEQFIDVITNKLTSAVWVNFHMTEKQLEHGFL